MHLVLTSFFVAFQDMVRGNRYKTIRWSFVESLEPPRVVHIRCTSIVNQGNLYGQVTVRMHSRQVCVCVPHPSLLPFPADSSSVHLPVCRLWPSTTALGG